MISAAQQALPTPTDSLISPTKDFFLYKRSKVSNECSRCDELTWHCTIEGIPIRLKNTRSMDSESAIETWTELITNRWDLVEHHINENAA